MEADKHYFIEGLFIIVIGIAAAFFALWLTRTEQRDDVLYRIHFSDMRSADNVGTDAGRFW